MHGQRVGGVAALAAERRQELARVLLTRELEQARARNAARLEEVARSIEQAHDANLRAAIRRRDLIGQRAAHAAEAEQHHVRAPRRNRPSAANLRQLKRRVHAARGLGRVAFGDDERDVALRRALGDRHDADAGRVERREHARGNAGRADHAFADDRNHGHAGTRRHVVDEAAREFVGKRRANGRDRARGFGLGHA